MPRRTDNFSKFIDRKNNAAIKEGFRQEKKAAKKERKEAIERHFEAKRQAKAEQQTAKAAVPSRGPSPKAPAPASKSPVPTKGPASKSTGGDLIPLNKYIAHGGICSRRDAADLIRQGNVEVNGQLIIEPGTKVSPSDIVKVGGKKVTISKNFVYILLNKPKDYITTTDDPQGRKTVLDLIRQATTERVFPVGRLDRNTSGVLLLTNDGDLAQKLAHPRHEIKKIYHVTLDKPLTKADFDKIVEGVTLEDGVAHVDVLAYADAKDKAQIGLEIHSGRNRIVRRIFEHLGYDVRGLDRVTYAGLTKKNVQRGHWRLLTEKEIRILKYLNASFRGSLAAPASTTAKNAPAAGETEFDKPAKPVKYFKSSRPKTDSPVDPQTHKYSGPKKHKPTGSKPYKPTGSDSGKPRKPFGDANKGPRKPSRPDTGKPASPATRKPARPADPNALRGRKSGGSYNKSKARDQFRETKRKRNSQ